METRKAGKGSREINVGGFKIYREMLLLNMLCVNVCVHMLWAKTYEIRSQLKKQRFYINSEAWQRPEVWEKLLYLN